MESKKTKKRGAPKGSKNKLKLKESKERKEMFERFCDHVSRGLSQTSFPELCYNTIHKYMKDYPEDCPKEKLDKALRESMLFWETVGLQGTIGKIPYFNPTTWIFNMKNRFPKEWSDSVKVDVNEDPFVKAIEYAFGRNKK